jgi:hypothetical protein
MRRPLLGFLAAFLALGGLLAPGCSLGPREDWANAMRDAIDVAKRAGDATVKQTVTIKVVETNIRQRPVPLLARSTGAANFTTGLAELDGTAPRKLGVVYDDLQVFATRSKASVKADGKEWARFNYGNEPKEDIDDNDRRMAVGAGLISPVVAIELLDGVLTGSVKEIGRGMKAGAETTHYTARLAPDAAIIEIRDEDRKEGVARMFATLGVQQDDFLVDVWIDDQNRVRGLKYNMRQQKDRVNAFDMSVSWEFTDFGEQADVVEPAGDEVATYDRFRDFITELIREFA